MLRSLQQEVTVDAKKGAGTESDEPISRNVAREWQCQIFQDGEDNEQFIETLRGYKETSGYQVYAYCLMGNHVHLLIRTDSEGEPLSRIFRRIGAQYV